MLLDTSPSGQEEFGAENQPCTNSGGSLVSGRLERGVLTLPSSYSTISPPANGALGPGPRTPLLRSTTGVWRMTKLGMARGMGTGGGPAITLRTYQTRRRTRQRSRPLGNRGRKGVPTGWRGLASEHTLRVFVFAVGLRLGGWYIGRPKKGRGSARPRNRYPTT